MSRSRVFGALWLALAATYVFAGVFGTVAWHGGPRAGVEVSFAGGVPTVTRLDPAGPAWAAGVREGDRLLTVDGVASTSETWSETGDVAASMVFLQASGRHLSVATDQGGVPGTGGIVGLEITGALFALVGLVVFTRSYRSPQVATFSLFALMAAIAIASAPGAAVGHPWSRVIEGTALHWLPVASVAFFLVLSRDAGPSSRLRLPRWVLVMPAGALTLDLVAALRSTVSPGLHEADSTATFVFLTLGLILGPALLIRNYVRSESPVLREQTRVIAFGTLIGILPVVLLSAIPKGAGIGFIVQPEITVIAAAIIPLAFAYAILRHELMGIRRLVHRGVSYAMISVLVLAVYVAAIVSIRTTGGGDVGADSPLALTLLIVLLAGVPFVPRVRELAFSTVNRLLYRDFVDHREVVRRVSVLALEETDVPSLMDAVLARVSNALGLSYAAYLQRSGDLESLSASFCRPDDRFMQSLWMKGLDEGGTAPGPIVEPAGDREGEYLFLPISHGGSRPGVLALGPKTTGEPFREDDLHMVQTIAGFVSTAAARLHLLDELREKNIELTGMNARLVEVEEQERARLSAYLHDEPLQKVTYALSQYREGSFDEDLASVLGDAARELRSISASLSPAVLADLGLVRALEWLASETESRAGFNIDFRCDGLTREQRLPSAIELVAYRVVQEALTNCQKHSGATAVWVSLQLEDGNLLVSVEDNGKGLAPIGQRGGRRPEQLGLLGMRQRVESQNGHLVVENRRSRGLRVAASIPVRQAPN